MGEKISVKLRVLSFMAMVMIIYLHSYNLVVKIENGNVSIKKDFNSFIQVFVSDGLTRIAVPLFAAISGYLFFYIFKPSLVEFLFKYKRRCKSLVLPYLIWSAWGILFYFILQAPVQTRKFFNGVLIKDYGLGQILKILLWDPLPYQLWFLRDLIFLVILTPVLYTIIKYLKWFAILLFLVVWFRNYNLYILSPDTFFFFSLGVHLAINVPNFLILKYRELAILTLVLYLSLLILKTYLFQIDFYSDYTYLLLKGSILSGIFAVWFLYDMLFDNINIQTLRWYRYTSYSFFLYAFHEPVLTLLKKATIYIFGRSEWALLVSYIFLPLVVVLSALTIGVNLKKHVVNFYNLITGGR